MITESQVVFEDTLRLLSFLWLLYKQGSETPQLLLLLSRQALAEWQVCLCLQAAAVSFGTSTLNIPTWLSLSLPSLPVAHFPCLLS